MTQPAALDSCSLIKSDSNLRILVIIDSNYHSLLVQREIARRFEQANVQVVRTANEALASIKERYIDVAVVDMDSPSNDQDALIRRIRQLDPEVSLICLTAENSDAVARRFFECGVEELLVKDSAYHVVVPRLIEQVCSRKQNWSRRRFVGRTTEPDMDSEIIKAASNTLSHEINNPLMTIMGLAELLLQESNRLDPALAEKIRIIEQSAIRIKNTLKKLSNLSQPLFRQTLSGKLVAAGRHGLLKKSSN